MCILCYKTYKISKKIAEIKFIFILVLLLFLSVNYEMSFYLAGTFSSKNFANVQTYNFIIRIVYIVGSLYYIYLLAGARLIYAIRHPIKNGSFNGNSVHDDYFSRTVNLVDFIPLKKGEKTFSFLERNNTYDSMDKNYKYNVINSHQPPHRSSNNNNNNENINNYIDNYINNYNNYLNNYHKNNESYNSTIRMNTSTSTNTNTNATTSNNTNINTNTNNNDNDYYGYIDAIDNNPNNYFFNQSLKMLSQQNDTENYYYRKKR